MIWFRTNIRRGVVIALFALSIQFVLSFGHSHPIHTDEHASQSISKLEESIGSKLTAAQEKPRSDHDSDRKGDFCAICAVIALTSTMLAASPPRLAVPTAVEFIYQAADPYVVLANPTRIFFQPRAPPLS